MKRRLRAMQVKYDEYKELADGYAGPAVVETFGEVPFEPVNKKQALHLNERQQKLRVGFQNEAGQIVNRYIKDDEYGYTIIAYPMPAFATKEAAEAFQKANGGKLMSFADLTPEALGCGEKY